MKKLLAIMVLGLLFISIDLSNPTTVKAAKTLEEISKSLGKDKRGWLEKQLDKVPDLNPVNYFEKRKKCKQVADNQDTVAIGKLRYKECMNDYR